jgi:hypothetical protein
MTSKGRPRSVATERGCKGCGQVLPLNEFYDHKGAPQGKDYLCKRCNKNLSTFKAIKRRGLERLRKELTRDMQLSWLKQQAILALEEEQHDPIS